MKNTIMVGRSPDNDIVLDLPQISNNHARFTQEGDGFWVEDLGSINGVFVNNQRITRCKVTFSDKVSLGSAPFSMDNLRSEILSKISSTAKQDMPPKRPDMSTDMVITIGRSPENNLVFDSPQVSSYHAKVTVKNGNCLIEDLNSTNGVFVNGNRIKRAPFSMNDDIHFGSFRFETSLLNKFIQAPPQAVQFQMQHQVPGPAAHIQRLPVVPAVSNNTPVMKKGLSKTMLFPILGSKKRILGKGYLAPAVVTIVTMVGLFSFVGDFKNFAYTLGGYLGLASFYIVYMLCGKKKAWWIFPASGLATAMLLKTPLLAMSCTVFRGWLPGSWESSKNVMKTFFYNFIGAGMMEEFIKIIPVLLLMFIIPKFFPERQKDLGIEEPLDGILIAAASAIGFILIETLLQYVPKISLEVLQKTKDPGLAMMYGTQLLIPRVLGGITGHVAYSGYFGYFIGLSVLRPQYRIKIILIGYLTSSALHGLWNSSGMLGELVMCMVAFMSYLFLIAAILKARQLSPGRRENFATKYVG